jgi:hypothetical protein
VGFVHVMSSVEIDGVKALLYLKTNDILSIFFTFFLLFVHKSLLCDNEFHKNRHGESHTLVRGINELLSVLSASLVHLG